MTFSHNMEALSNNNVFNFGGWGTTLAFFGAQASTFANIVSITPIVTFIIGIFSLVFIIMRVYLTYLETKKLKDEIKENEIKHNE